MDSLASGFGEAGIFLQVGRHARNSRRAGRVAVKRKTLLRENSPHCRRL